MGADLVAGDRGSLLRVTCRDNATKQVIDLAGKTVTLRYAINEAAPVDKVMAVLEPATNGKATYQFAAADLTPGAFTGEILLQSGAADQVTSVGLFYLTVRAAL
ncbi:MAG: hypothetical protein Q8N00_00440 [Nitrospirota bacterium]|nr:hypothetical protein [Nitrospirota bacterium]MDP3598955.1 hypothetical protein [Nitrospirota bacterium]